MEELAGAVERFDADPEVRCIVIAGSDEVFAAGADIGALAEREFHEALFHPAAAFWRRLAECRTPMVAAVSGWALGGGCELALICDLIVASETAEFGQPEITLGIIPGGGGTQRLARAIGKQRAMELVLTGRRFDAAEARADGDRQRGDQEARVARRGARARPPDRHAAADRDPARQAGGAGRRGDGARRPGSSRSAASTSWRWRPRTGSRACGRSSRSASPSSGGAEWPNIYEPELDDESDREGFRHRDAWLARPGRAPSASGRACTRSSRARRRFPYHWHIGQRGDADRARGHASTLRSPDGTREVAAGRGRRLPARRARRPPADQPRRRAGALPRLQRDELAGDLSSTRTRARSASATAAPGGEGEAMRLSFVDRRRGRLLARRGAAVVTQRSSSREFDPPRRARGVSQPASAARAAGRLRAPRAQPVRARAGLGRVPAPLPPRQRGDADRARRDGWRCGPPTASARSPRARSSPFRSARPGAHQVVNRGEEPGADPDRQRDERARRRRPPRVGEDQRLRPPARRRRRGLPRRLLPPRRGRALGRRAAAPARTRDRRGRRRRRRDDGRRDRPARLPRRLRDRCFTIRSPRRSSAALERLRADLARGAERGRWSAAEAEAAAARLRAGGRARGPRPAASS